MHDFPPLQCYTPPHSFPLSQQLSPFPLIPQQLQQLCFYLELQLLYQYYTAIFMFSIQQQRQVQMNMKHPKISSSNSYQNLGQYYYQPLSPFNKISTPLRNRINTSTPNAHNTSINFASAIVNSKSPIGKENTALLQNQSPLANRFKVDQSNFSSEQQNSPIMRMMSKKRGKVGHHGYHKSDALELDQQYYENRNDQPQNFEESLKFLAARSPQNRPQIKTKGNASKSPHNFKGILQAQDYEIRKKDGEQRKAKATPSLKKSFSTSQYNTKLFNSGFENSQRKLPCEQARKEEISCMNNDGNIAKYMTIVRQDNEERLYYCSKCTVLLVGQGFILQEINNSQINESEQVIEDESRVEECKDKLKSLINDLEMRQAFESGRLSSYYEQLYNVLNKCKNENEERLKQLYTQKIEEYESLLKQLQHFDLSLNYRNRQQDIESYYQSIIRLKLGQPLLKKYEESDLQRYENSFQQYAKQNLQLNFDQQPQSSKEQQGIPNRNNGLRFSFQKLLNDISSKKTKMQSYINTLQQEQEEQSDYIQNCLEENRKTAFRDLFPEGDDSHQVNCSVNSPTFKHF